MNHVEESHKNKWMLWGNKNQMNIIESYESSGEKQTCKINESSGRIACESKRVMYEWKHALHVKNVWTITNVCLKPTWEVHVIFGTHFLTCGVRCGENWGDLRFHAVSSVLSQEGNPANSNELKCTSNIWSRLLRRSGKQHEQRDRTDAVSAAHRVYSRKSGWIMNSAWRTIWRD